MAERLLPVRVGKRTVVVVEKDDGTATINQDGKELFVIEEIDGSVEVRLTVVPDLEQDRPAMEPLPTQIAEAMAASAPKRRKGK